MKALVAALLLIAAPVQAQAPLAIGTPLQGKVFAKTGALNATAAFSGFLTAASGRTLVFATYAADMPGDMSASPGRDAALNLIPAEN